MTATDFAVALVRDDSGDLRVVCRDLPEVVTWGRDEAAALAEAADAIEVVLSALIDRNRDVPAPSPAEAGEHVVALPAALSAKVALWRAFKAAGISKSELARRLDVDETEARRILDPKHGTRIDRLSEAAAALGKRMVVSVEDAACRGPKLPDRP